MGVIMLTFGLSIVLMVLIVLITRCFCDVREHNTQIPIANAVSVSQSVELSKV